MKSLVIFALLVLSAQAADFNTSAVKVQVVESIEAYKAANPNVTVTELTSYKNTKLNQNLYTLGSRVSGDRFIAGDNGYAQYPSKQNLELTVRYPAQGVGNVVTFVQILITQDDGTYGRGYVTSGGIGQRYISLVVEAWNTAYIRYDYAFYGY